MGPEEVLGRVPYYRSNMPCGNRYVDEIRALGNQRHRNQPMDPQGTIVTVLCAEEDFARETRKGSKLAPDLATVTWSAKT